MNDKELLELAAKAAEMNPMYRYCDAWSGMYLYTPQDGYFGKGWNPLTDDGDALRLAVKLEIDVQFYNVHSHHVCVNDYIYEQLDNDPYAVTRRAIVRAAAEIGKELP